MKFTISSGRTPSEQANNIIFEIIFVGWLHRSPRLLYIRLAGGEEILIRMEMGCGQHDK